MHAPADGAAAQAAARAHLGACLAHIPAGAVCSLSVGRRAAAPPGSVVLQAGDAGEGSPRGAGAGGCPMGPPADAPGCEGGWKERAGREVGGGGGVASVLISRCVPGRPPLVLEVDIAGWDEVQIPALLSLGGWRGLCRMLLGATAMTCGHIQRAKTGSSCCPFGRSPLVLEVSCGG